MDKEAVKKLTLGLYKVTELFPEKEPVKFYLREKAVKILGDASLFFSKNPVKLNDKQRNELADDILKNINLLQVYFEVAKFQGWSDQRNFLILDKEYQKIKEEIENLIKPINTNQAGEKEDKEVVFDNFRNERTKKIMDFLKTKDKAQVWEFKEIFPEVTKRTLRRDFEYLLANNLVEREGEGKYTFYKIKTANNE